MAARRSRGPGRCVRAALWRVARRGSAPKSQREPARLPNEQARVCIGETFWAGEGRGVAGCRPLQRSGRRRIGAGDGGSVAVGG